MKCSMTGQDKGDLLIQVTTWTGSTVFVSTQKKKTSKEDLHCTHIKVLQLNKQV
jgi:hypothetical protein